MFWEYQLYTAEEDNDKWSHLVQQVSEVQGRIDSRKRSCSVAGLTEALEHLNRARVAIEAGQ